MKKPGVISFAIDFGKDQKNYKHISILSHDIGLLYSIHLGLIWEKYKDIRLRIYDGEEEISIDNCGYKTRVFISASKDLTELKVYKPDRKVKLKILDLLQDVIDFLSKQYSWDQGSVKKAYDEVKNVIDKDESLPNFIDTFYGKESWKTL